MEEKKQKNVRVFVGLMVLALLCVAQGFLNRYLTTYDTIADLIASNRPDGSYRRVRVLGYWTANDGGGGEFYSNQTVANTNRGTRIYSGITGWSYERIHAPGVFCVEWFGAATNLADNKIYIQDCADTAGRNAHVVFQTPGTFTNSDSLKFYTGQAWMGISGGPTTGMVNGITNQTELTITHATNPVLTPNDTSIDTHNIRICDLKLTGTATTVPVLNLKRVSNGEFTRMYVASGVLGVLVDASGGQAFFNYWRGCTIGYQSSYGLSFTNGANDNTYYAGFIGGSPTGVVNTASSAANAFVTTHFQGVGGSTPTATHVYNNGGELKLIGCYIEQATSTAIYDGASGATDVMNPTWGGSITTYTTAASNVHHATRLETRPGGTDSMFQIGKFTLTNNWNTTTIFVRFGVEGASFASSGVAWAFGYGITTASSQVSDFYEGTSSGAQINHRTGSMVANLQNNGGFLGNLDLRLRRVSSTKWQLADASNNDADAAFKDGVASGNLVASVVGKGLQIKEGTNAKMGTATLVAGTVTVSTTAVTASSRVFLTTSTSGGTVGHPYVSARTAGTSFTITSTSGTDTSTIAWMLVEPAP